MEEISKDAELKKMQSQLSKFKLEAKLRRNLASEIEKQKQIALAAQSVAQEKSKELEVLSLQLAKYLPPQLYQSIFHFMLYFELNLPQKNCDYNMFSY